MDRFANIPDDAVIYMALVMDLPDILSLCQTSQRFNRVVCNRDSFWINRLNMDYGIKYLDVEILGTPKQAYESIKTEPLTYLVDYDPEAEIIPPYVWGKALELVYIGRGGRKKRYGNYILYGSPEYIDPAVSAYTKKNAAIDSLIVSLDLQNLINGGHFEDNLNTTFQKFYGVESVEEFNNNIKSRMDKVDQKGTVILRIKNSDDRTLSHIPYDIFILHRYI